MQILGLFQIDFLLPKLNFFLFLNITQHFLLLFLALKQQMEKGLIFLQKSWSIPFGKMQILSFLNRCFYSLKRLHQTLFIDLFCIKRKVAKSLNFWTITMV